MELLDTDLLVVPPMTPPTKFSMYSKRPSYLPRASQRDEMKECGAHCSRHDEESSDES